MAENTQHPTTTNRKVTTFLGKNKEDHLRLQTAEFAIHVFLTILFYLAVVAAITKVGNVAYDFAYPIFGDASVARAPGEDKKVTITEHESTSSVIHDLKNKGLIINDKSFYIRCKLSLSDDKKILPGTYVLNTSMTYEEILEILTNTEKDTEE